MPIETITADTPAVKPRSKLRLAIHAMLERDPELSVAEVEAAFPGKRNARFFLYEERKEQSLTSWRAEMKDGNVHITLVIPREDYEHYRAASLDGSVGGHLLRAARGASKK